MMGASTSSNGLHQTLGHQQQQGQGTGSDSINIQFTKDVLNRWKTVAIASSLASASPATSDSYSNGTYLASETFTNPNANASSKANQTTGVGSGEEEIHKNLRILEELQRSCDSSSQQQPSETADTAVHLESKVSSSSDTDGDYYLPKREYGDGSEELKNSRDETQFGNFEHKLKAAKESLQQMTDALGQEKIILGVSIEGHPTVETISTWKVRQEKEEELRQNNLFWTDKLETIKGEYMKSVEQDIDAFLKKTENIQEISPPPKDNICHSLCSKVLDCYIENKKEVLNCRSIVKKFAECVHSNCQG